MFCFAIVCFAKCTLMTSGRSVCLALLIKNRTHTFDAVVCGEVGWLMTLSTACCLVRKHVTKWNRIFQNDIRYLTLTLFQKLAANSFARQNALSRWALWKNKWTNYRHCQWLLCATSHRSPNSLLHSFRYVFHIIFSQGLRELKRFVITSCRTETEMSFNEILAFVRSCTSITLWMPLRGYEACQNSVHTTQERKEETEKGHDRFNSVQLLDSVRCLSSEVFAKLVSNY